jgi:hypothetical protein
MLNNLYIETNLSENYEFNQHIDNIYNKHKNILILIAKNRIIRRVSYYFLRMFAVNKSG